jgi:hypothetical protein
LVLAEPDFAIVNLPTTLRLPKWGQSFRLTHRFLDNLRTGAFLDHLDDVFGLDNGAVIASMPDLAHPAHAVRVFRNNVDRRSSSADLISSAGQRDAGGGFRDRLHRRHPWLPRGHGKATATTSACDNGGQRSPQLRSLGRTLGTRVALYAMPMWVHNTRPAGSEQQDTGYIGLGGRARIRPKVYVVAEMSPRFFGYAPSTMEYGFGIERRAGGHNFQLTFTNAVAGTYGQLARGGFPSTIYLGFMLSRKFF